MYPVVCGTCVTIYDRRYWPLGVILLLCLSLCDCCFYDCPRSFSTRWRFVSAQLSNKFGYCPSRIYTISQTQQLTNCVIITSLNLLLLKSICMACLCLVPYCVFLCFFLSSFFSILAFLNVPFSAFLFSSFQLGKVNSKHVHCKILPMTGFEPRTPGIKSDRPTEQQTMPILDFCFFIHLTLLFWQQSLFVFLFLLSIHVFCSSIFPE